MYYDKRIRYLSYYESDIKLQNAGYVKFQVRDSLCQMIINVKGPRLMGSGEARVYLLSERQGEISGDGFYTGGRKNNLEKHFVGTLNIRNGQGYCAVRLDAENMAGSGLRYDEICGIKIELHEYQYLESQWNVVNFMPARQKPQGSEPVGYRLRQPQGGERKEEPVEISLIVTPVSENSRVEKIVKEESAKKEDSAKLFEGDTPEEIVMEIAEDTVRENAAKGNVIRGNVVRENAGQEISADREQDREERKENAEGVNRMGILPDDGDSMQRALEREILRERESQTEQQGRNGTASEQERAGRMPEQEQSERRNTIPEYGQRERTNAVSGQEPLRSMEEMKEAERIEEIEIRLPEQELQSDKWEQLKLTYPIVHPIREDEEYLKISPKDFVIFTEKYQELVHNSFLLHGYYNYKHLILGKKEKDGKAVYYLGVPGTFHDREKSVAVMFGFEAFDGKREPTEKGDFGYYLRRVEI